MKKMVIKKRKKTILMDSIFRKVRECKSAT